MANQDEYFEGIAESELSEGKMKHLYINGTPVLFVKQQGQIYVLDNRCPHMGCAFSGGTLDGVLIICPCHEWRFNLKTGEYEKEDAFTLTFYEWKIKDGKIWVYLPF